MKQYKCLTFLLAMSLFGCGKPLPTTTDSPADSPTDSSPQPGIPSDPPKGDINNHIEQNGLKVQVVKGVNYDIILTKDQINAYMSNSPPIFNKRGSPVRSTPIEKNSLEDFYLLTVNDDGLLEGYPTIPTVKGDTTKPFVKAIAPANKVVYTAPVIRKAGGRNHGTVPYAMSLITVMRADGQIFVSQVSPHCYDRSNQRIYTNANDSNFCRNMTYLGLVDHAALGGIKNKAYLSGRIEVKDGRILKLSNNSGNYPNSNDSFKTFIYALALQGYLDQKIDFDTTYRFNPNDSSTHGKETEFLEQDTSLALHTVKIELKQQKITVKYNCEKGHYPDPPGINASAEHEPVVQGINFKALSLDKKGVMTLDPNLVNANDFLLSAYCPGYHDTGQVLSYSAAP